MTVSPTARLVRLDADGGRALRAAHVRVRNLADETVILLHPPLPLVGVSIVMERDRQQNDRLADG